MIYLVAYKQLKHQLQRVLGKGIRCIAIDYPFEEGEHLTNITFPDSDSITLVLGHDIRSKLLLLATAKKFPKKTYVIELNGEYTHMAPLAVSDRELTTCCENAYLIHDELRRKLIDEYNNLSKSKYLCINQAKVYLLSEKEIDHFIINQISTPMDIKNAVGRCMGNAPFGWPITDTFYYNQICRMQESGKLKFLHSCLFQ